MNLLALDQSRQAYMEAWAAKNGWKILDCSSPETPFTHEYAASVGGKVVPDPRAGRPGCVLVVQELPHVCVPWRGCGGDIGACIHCGASA